MFKIGHSWAILGGLGGPLGAQPILPEPYLAEANQDTRNFEPTGRTIFELILEAWFEP
jgi:hypothetical protein